MTSFSSLIAGFLLFAIATAAPAVISETSLPTSLRSAFTARSELRTTSRQGACSSSGPCQIDDAACMAGLALKYTNEFRASQGVGPLKQGTKNQFDNTVYYSGVLRQMGGLKHQDIGAVQVGCGTRIQGENIAQNHCDEDPARKCINAWINSPGHRANMLTERFETVSVGIVNGPGTTIWCTQTFGVGTIFEASGGCAPVGGNNNVPTSPAPSTPAPSTPAPSTPVPATPSPSPAAGNGGSDQNPAVEHSCQNIEGPCKVDDPACMSGLAMQYTNEFRATQGVSPLKQGSVNQYQNALYYSGVLQRMGRLEHQDIGSVQIGCSGRLSGENIAINSCSGNPVRNCIDAWINSPGHRANMLSTNHDTVSVGIVFGPGSRIFCTQTFAVRTEFQSTGGCAALTATNAGNSDDNTDTDNNTTDNNTTTDNTNMTTDSANPCAGFVRPEFLFQGRTWVTRTVNGECRYCIKDTQSCAAAADSAGANTFFKNQAGQ